ncbi:lipopolysaccharide kinase InaA family protein [Mangrovimonas aestuarii]|uniref:lipopolysaccharide kinase InaA family protein n=1 Tax=Mangrovimonas aestuarii TaxID=3018443 RepID=UPI002379FC5C|nr:lipopolysaccharide kinase InaA family protein [Mangrovimonas aestuarii]
MKNEFANTYQSYKADINGIIERFDSSGEEFGNQDRNTIKLFEFNGQVLNVKSFRVPNIVNQIAYKFFRKSKAQRSFEYANKLMEMGIGTPQPIAYYEFTSPFLFKRSFYISEHLDCDLTYRELITNPNYPDHEEILRAFTRFTFELHEKGVHFLDHSPGNTLIKKVDDGYAFYLVDLNRMEFKTMSFEDRIKNFSRLSKFQPMVEVMSDEYAKCIGAPYEKVFKAMWGEIQGFQARFSRRRRLKRMFKPKRK